MVEGLFLTVPRGCLQFVIVVFPDHTHLLFCDIAWKVGMSLSTVHLILKKHLKVRNIFARWVPHLLTDEQNRQRVLVAKKLLKMFQTYDKKQFVNVVPGDENQVY